MVFWCIVITILTVGYGDYYPQSFLGRTIAVFACLWGTFLISLLVVSLTNSVDFTQQEEKAYEELKNNTIDKELKTKGVEMLRCAFRLTKYPQKKQDIEREDTHAYIHDLGDWKKSLFEFKKTRKFVIAKEHEVSAENILYKLNENISEEMEWLIGNSNDLVNSLKYYVECSNDVQKEINKYMEILEQMTKGLHTCIRNSN